MRRAGSQPVTDSGRTDRRPHLDRKRPGARTSPGARGAVTKALSLYRRTATRMGMRRPKTDGPPEALDFFSTLGLLLGAAGAAGAAGAEAVGWSCDARFGWDVFEKVVV